MVSNGAKLLTQVVVAEIRRWRQRRSHLAKTFSRRGSGRSASVPSGPASAASPPCPESVDNYKVVVALVGAVDLVFGEIDR